MLPLRAVPMTRKVKNCRCGEGAKVMRDPTTGAFYCDGCAEVLSDPEAIPNLLGVLARNVAELNRRLETHLGEDPEPTPSYGPDVLIGAAEAAEIVGFSPDWVRRNKERLGAIRTGAGPRPRLRFPLASVIAFSEHGQAPAAAPDPSRSAKPKPTALTRRRGTVELLPIAEPVEQ